MRKQTSSALNRSLRRPRVTDPGVAKLALDEHELSTRWSMSVKTLRRWRQEQVGPVFCKLGARVIYLISEVEAYEKRFSRFSTGTRASA